jgi:hypothetical protein
LRALNPGPAERIVPAAVSGWVSLSFAVSSRPGSAICADVPIKRWGTSSRTPPGTEADLTVAFGRS